MAVNTRDLLQFLRAHHSAAIEAHLDTTLAALADQWQPARAQIASRIGWLQDLMQQAQDAGVEIDPTWLAQEQRLTTLLREIDDATQSFADDARSTIGDAQLDAIDLAQQAAQEYMQAALPDGVAATFGVPPQGALDAMASALEEDSPLSALFDAFGADASASASQALFSAVALGQSAAQIADLLERTTDMSAQRAEVIARTELLRSYRDAQMANYRANADVVTAWMWSASFSERTCGACLAMDSTIHPLEDSLDDHICGRCTALPVTTPYKDILGQLGIDASANPALALDTTAFAGILGAERQTGAEWLAAQDYATQVRILGPAKAAAIYKYGDITLQDLVGINKSALWGDSIREHSLRELGLNARDYLTEFKLPPRELLGAGEAAAAQEAERVAQAAAAATQQVDWEAEHVADLSRSLGVEPAPALFGRQVEQGNAAWEDWYHTHLAPLLPKGYVDPVFGPATSEEGRAYSALARGLSTVSSETRQALDSAQARVDALRQQWEQAAKKSLRPKAAEIKAAQLDLARAQAVADAEAGGRGAVLLTPYDQANPFGAWDHIEERLSQAFGRDLTNDEIGGVVGAPKGAYVLFERNGERGLTINLYGPSWNPLRPNATKKAEYEALRTLEVKGKKTVTVTVHNAWFGVRKDLQGEGLGAQIFADEAQTLSDLGVKYISTDAIGDATTIGARAGANGFYTWPRLGYVGKLPADVKQALRDAVAAGEAPKGWGRFTSIQQLMQTPEGRAWWKANGVSLGDLRFDLKPDSLSMRLLNDYLDEKGIAARASSAGLDDLAQTVARAQDEYRTVEASYDLTKADQAFAADLQQRVAALDQSAITHTDALDIGGLLHDRITSDADLLAFQGYAQEAADIRAVAPNLTDEQRAWARGDPDAVAAHGGVKWLEAEARAQAEYQARVAAYLAEVRDLGGDLNITARAGSAVSDRVFGLIDNAQTYLPSDWIAASNDLGALRINEIGRAANYGGYYQGFVNGNGAIAIDTNMVRDTSVQSTFIHELMHRMEDAIPQLSRLEADFYEARTAGEGFVALTNGIDAQTKLDQWVDEYLGREPYPTAANTTSFELLSIGAEAALGGGATYDLNALRQDNQFMSFILGLLTIVRADGGAAAGAEAAAIAEEAATAINEAKLGAQQAERAFSIAGEGRDESSTVTYASDAARERIAQPFAGQALSDEEVARLAGAPPGSSVTVSRIGEITVTPPDGRYTSSVIVQQGDDGVPTLLNWRFEGPDGTNDIPLDPEALAMQVRQANALGVDVIHMKARSASSDYALLPQLGYNAPIGVALIESRSASLPAELRDARTLLDLVATPEGRAWWGENGLNPGLDFDPRPGSRSWLTLNAYLHDHGFKGLDE